MLLFIRLYELGPHFNVFSSCLGNDSGWLSASEDGVNESDMIPGGHGEKELTLVGPRASQYILFF